MTDPILYNVDIRFEEPVNSLLSINYAKNKPTRLATVLTTLPAFTAFKTSHITNSSILSTETTVPTYIFIEVDLMGTVEISKIKLYNYNLKNDMVNMNYKIIGENETFNRQMLITDWLAEGMSINANFNSIGGVNEIIPPSDKKTGRYLYFRSNLTTTTSKIGFGEIEVSGRMIKHDMYNMILSFQNHQTAIIYTDNLKKILLAKFEYPDNSYTTKDLVKINNYKNINTVMFYSIQDVINNIANTTQKLNELIALADSHIV